MAELRERLAPGRVVRTVGLAGTARAWVLARLAKKLDAPLICVTPDDDAADALATDLSFFLGGDGTRLRELTVHHKDGNHDRNPPDGSNWELLCLYCHENEHARETDAKAGGSVREAAKAPATHNPLASLADLLKGKPKG